MHAASASSRRLERIEATACGVMVAASLSLAGVTALAWFDDGVARVNAWDGFDRIDLILLLTLITGACVGFSVAIFRPARTRALGSLAALAGAFATVLLLITSADPPGGASLEAGIYLGVLATTAITVSGAFMAAFPNG